MEVLDRGILNIMQKVSNDEWSFCFLHDLGLDQQGEVALRLSNLTYQDDSVLNMSPDDILNKACVALLFDKKTDKVIASASMMKPQINSLGWKLGEIGSMFTLEDYQNQGCASYLVHKIDEWAEAQPTIDGTYAFLNSKSPRSFAVNGYSGEIKKDGKILNAAEIVPAYAFNLCRTICRDEKAIYLMDLELRKKELQGPEPKEGNGELLRIKEELRSARIKRQVRFENLINENKLKINAIAARKDLSTEQIDHDIEVHYKIIDFYIDNFKNNLHCCDVVVAKLF